jgi:hypothetical protein
VSQALVQPGGQFAGDGVGFVLGKPYNARKILRLSKLIDRTVGVCAEVAAHICNVGGILQRGFQIQQQNRRILGGVGFDDEELVFRPICLVIAEGPSGSASFPNKWFGTTLAPVRFKGRSSRVSSFTGRGAGGAAFFSGAGLQPISMQAANAIQTNRRISNS